MGNTTCITCGVIIPSGSGGRCASHRSVSRRLRASEEWTRLSRLARAAGVCGYCEKPFPPEDLEADHIIPVRIAPGRAYDRTNVIALCRPCHRMKTAHDQWEQDQAIAQG